MVKGLMVVVALLAAQSPVLAQQSNASICAQAKSEFMSGSNAADLARASRNQSQLNVALNKVSWAVARVRVYCPAGDQNWVNSQYESLMQRLSM